MQVSAQTSLTIVGTAHQPTSHLNADSIYKLLLKIKPDVILQELDTALMDSRGNYKGRAINNTGNEFLASAKYRQVNNKVIFRRFDIIDRSFYYDRHNTFAMEAKVDKSVDSAWKYMPKTDMQMISVLTAANNTLKIMDDPDIYTINSKAYSNFAAFHQDWMYNKWLEVIARTPALRQYYDFWKEDGDFWVRRNNAMVNNIADYIKTFKGKSIVVLTGSMHKYLLTGGLTPLQDKLDFKLKDLP